jgi:hypothetical protein
MTQQKTDLNTVIAELEAQRDAIDAAILSLKKVLAAFVPQSAGSQGASTGEVQITKSSFFGMSLQDAAAKYLRMTPHVTQGAKKIADALEAGGFEHNSKRFFNTVYNSLDRYKAPNGEFVNVKGEWGLIEWYPDYKPKAPRKGEENGARQGETEPDENLAGDIEEGFREITDPQPALPTEP